jgi:GntR family transcriptional repressor for pyruvate dehydrogenase complex
MILPEPLGFDGSTAPASFAIPSRTDTVVDSIKRMITTGALKAGSRLPIEKDLALELGVSRSSLREGVRALCSMGVLETRQGDGTYVTSLDLNRLLAPMGFLVDLQELSDMSHVQAVRRVLETEAAGRAAIAISDEALGEAEGILASVDSLVSAGAPASYEAFIEADIQFHRVVSHAAGNPALEALIEALSSRTLRARTWRAITEQGVLAVTHGEHRAILRSLRIHDPDGARLRMGIHLLAVQDFMHDHPDAESTDQG